MNKKTVFWPMFRAVFIVYGSLCYVVSLLVVLPLSIFDYHPPVVRDVFMLTTFVALFISLPLYVFYFHLNASSKVKQAEALVTTATPVVQFLKRLGLVSNRFVFDAHRGQIIFAMLNNREDRRWWASRHKRGRV